MCTCKRVCLIAPYMVFLMSYTRGTRAHTIYARRQIIPIVAHNRIIVSITRVVNIL